MRVLIAAGGTAGHINPALAIAGALKKADPTAEIHFAGRKEGMEYRLVTQAGYPFHHIEITGFQRKLSLHNIKRNIITLWNLALSGPKAKAMMKEVKPDLVIGCGGYVSGPVVRCAAKMGIHTALHEQNAFPGVTNKNLAKKVDVVMLTAPEAEKLLKPKNPCVVTGLPIRGEIISANKEFARAEMKLDSRPLILSMGGSLGARAINEAVKYLILHRFEKEDCYYLHATGKAGASMIDDIGKDVDLNINPQIMLREYINDMDRCLAAADLVVCRAGASSLSEIQALGKPSILVPYPYAAENHQYYNAKTMSDRDAAILIEEKDFTGERLLSEVEKLLSKPERLKKMGENARAMAILDASQRITECVCKIVKN